MITYKSELLKMPYSEVELLKAEKELEIKILKILKRKNHLASENSYEKYSLYLAIDQIDIIKNIYPEMFI